LSRINSREAMMKKRMEKDPNDTEALGLTRSERHALDVAEGIQRDLDRAQREIDIVQDAQRGLGFDASQVDTIARAQADVASLDADEARIDLNEARVSLDDMRVNLDDFRPGLISNMVPSTSEMLRENVVNSLIKPPIPASHISQMLDTRTRIQGMLRTMPEVAVRSASVLPAASMATRISDMAKGFATSEILKNRQGLYSMVQTVNASFAESMADRILASKPLADWNQVMRNNTAVSIHRMNKDLVDAWRRMMMPNVDAIRRQMSSGIIGMFSQFDLEELERQARVQAARRPRTKIGFAAVKAYDELFLGNPSAAKEFLRSYLNLEPDPDRIEALWIVLKEAFERLDGRPAEWIVFDDERAAAYLHAAVYNQAQRVRRDRERPDRVWWTKTDPETKKRLNYPGLCSPNETSSSWSGVPATQQT
jgi:hypothetical protein